MSTPGDRQTLNEVLVTELGCLRPQLERNAPPATYQSTDAQRAEDLKGIYQSIDSSRLGVSAAQHSTWVSSRHWPGSACSENSTTFPASPVVATSPPGCGRGCTGAASTRSCGSWGKGRRAPIP